MQLVIDPNGEWLTVDQAAGIYWSRATLMRRVKNGTIKNQMKNGRRLIWVEPSEEQKLRTKVDDLESQVRELGRELEIATHQPTYKSVSRTEPPPEPCLSDSKQTNLEQVATELPARSDVFQKYDDIPYDDLMVRADAAREHRGWSDARVEKEAGLAKGFLRKARSGDRRGTQGRKSWGRLAAWLAA